MTAAIVGPSPHTHFVVALRSEAEPLVKRYRLERVAVGESPFPTFRGKGIWLVVSGIGRAASAAATGYLYARAGEPRGSVWINVGIAGHRRLAVGEGRLANKVSEASSERSWYPQICFTPPCPSAEVRTVDRVERTFADDALYDMEAAGFCATASRLTGAELMQVLKVVSDNLAEPAIEIDRGKVAALLAARLDELDAVRRSAVELAVELAATRESPPELERFLARWHFTVSERRRLERLLERWRALTAGGEPPWPEEIERSASAAAVLGALEKQVEAAFLAAPLFG